ncbi:MAG: hypothetical protein WB994_01880, partial [Candidatus Acidiferrum sp.]
VMTPSDQQTSWGSGSLTLKADAWPEETIPKNPQVSYYRARYYDSGPGRFLSEDPMDFGVELTFTITSRITRTFLLIPLAYGTVSPELTVTI